MMGVVLLLLLTLCSSALAFQAPAVVVSRMSSSSSSVSRQRPLGTTALHQAAQESSEVLSSVIEPDSADFVFDTGLGGVRLAEESVIKITGTIKHKPGFADPKISELVRYKSLTSVTEDQVKAQKPVVVCTGRGTEVYVDPGETVENKFTLAPLDAVRDALQGAGSAMQADSVVLNFAGGDDMMVSEVLLATKQMVLALDVTTKANISFNSISHATFPNKSCSLTVVALEAVDPEAEEPPQRGVNKAIAAGEVYFCDGNYWTCEASEINTAVA